MKNIVWRADFFGYFFLAVEEKLTGSKGFESKTAGRACPTGHKIKIKKFNGFAPVSSNDFYVNLILNLASKL